MKKAINYVICGTIFIDAETTDEAMNIMEDLDEFELLEESVINSITYYEAPMEYEH